ncbi:S41 family peptidase [Streptomyces montanisoli]|uniref:S41 family peptidase n=1 Tax=Streptomyces montanisoli TaxID=2798581 RepID=A0A940S095_9ACTN|nr:S41 family peptidase [Streptomyces montanisoli]MBP0460629.1 S41 family peptidase [Streptomyces montanisoli]
MTRSEPSTRRLHAYLMGAVHEIRKVGLFSSAVDWDVVDRDARQVLSTAGCYADTHSFLFALLQQAGGRHSHLTPPASASSRQRGDLMARNWGPTTPTGHLIGAAPAAVAYLRIPMLAGGAKPTRRYLADGTTVMRRLIAARPRGWIVDLRADLGGRAWPMIAVVRPLLPDGVLGHFLLPDGRAQAWSAHGGRITLDGRTMARSRVARQPDDHTPIAVLTSRHTASAGEVVALTLRAQPRARMIGTPTAGLTTGNLTRVLRDGTRLHVSGAMYADQYRNPINGPISVDQHLDDDNHDAALSAALVWMRRQDAPPRRRQ